MLGDHARMAVVTGLWHQFGTTDSVLAVTPVGNNAETRNQRRAQERDRSRSERPALYARGSLLSAVPTLRYDLHRHGLIRPFCARPQTVESRWLLSEASKGAHRSHATTQMHKIIGPTVAMAVTSIASTAFIPFATRNAAPSAAITIPTR